MSNLRILNVEVNDSASITVDFSETLTPNLVTANVSIIADTPNVPDASVLGIKISDKTLTITCQPLTSLASYFLQFQSVPLYPFQSIHGEATLLQDGVANKFLITGPMEPDNPVKNYLESFLKDNIYDLDDETNVVSQYIRALATNLSKALYDIRQIKNENYLSFTVVDENKVRGSGPFDRLNEEGAYQIIRVGLGPSTANASKVLPFSEFPSFPVTLQKQVAIETLKANSVDIVGQFNINTLTFNLSNNPVTKVNSIVFTLATINPVFVYDIETLGYQIKDSRYDQDFGFSFASLADNQIKISDKILDNPDFVIDQILKVDIEYEYKNLGLIPDVDNATVTTVLPATREVLPPIINVFNLQHAPVVNSNGDLASVGGVTFIDPNNNLPGAKHPAFLNEIIFRLNGLPSVPGQYSIDYATGTVYVYGNDLTNDGTGPSPPLATYKYLLTYKTEQDYVIDPDSYDIVALPLGNLVGFAGNINFNYEEVFVPDVDYSTALHKENLTERIENRLLALNALSTVNSPITNVFRIYNETSGEIYTVDRWFGNKVYFRYNTPPRILSQSGERVTFETITNELLFVDSTITNVFSLRIFRILLNNNNLVSSTEDSIAASFNTSLVFADGNVFANEIWFNRGLSIENNLNRLTSVGEYMADYTNGVAYVVVSNTQEFNIGTATYKHEIIVPQFTHLISVNDIYYRISTLDPKNKNFSYTNFGEGSILPAGLDFADELYLNGSVGAAYELLNGSVGAFVDAIFVSGVTNQVKSVRSVYEYQDLLNSTHPLNFATSSVSSGFDITVNPINKQFFGNVDFDGSNYFITIDENIPYLSPNITYVFSVVRTSDSAPLWDLTGTIVPGNPLKLILPGINSPMAGDRVNVTYSFTINDLSRVIVDYNKGDFFIDYTYLADEIIVSYEYGDNVLDFRSSRTVTDGTQYFVSYKVGALRDALLKNFGTLVNIPQLSNFDIDFDRERYRDALTAALSSFIQGPTVAAIKNIGKTISHIEPDVIESVFQSWSLGGSLLNQEPVSTSGSFELLPAKYDNGVLINQPDQTINLPVSSNLRFEEGTFETWIVPQWNGLDNDAELTFTITKDGYAISPFDIFVGAAEHHPELSNGVFSIDKNHGALGKPNTNKDGVFIYYDKDISGNFNRWYVQIVDGYVSPNSSAYNFKIVSDGTFYDTKSLILPKPSNMTMFTGLNTINLSISSDGYIDEGITFISDFDHYLLDFGKEKNVSRLSIYKDVSGYLNFRVYDRDKVSYAVSADVSAWKIGDAHHVAASWKLNTRNNRDELHLFIDGLEVPNIIKYGQKLKPYLHEKFRTVNPEEILGSPNRDIVGSIDLHTVAGINDVSSSINFSALNIFPGDIIYIDEIGFSTLGYTIININGQVLTLDAPMPLTLTDGRFSVNRTQYTVLSDIDTAPNIAVSTIHYTVNGNDLIGSMGFNMVSSAVDFTAAGILPGYLIKIDDSLLPDPVNILQVSGNILVIDEDLPVTLTGANFWVYSHVENEIPGVRALRPSYSIAKDSNFNNILTISNNVFAGDLVLIRTLGVNHREVKKQYYVWSTDKENILMTQLPPPISLDEAKITRIILPVTAIGPANSTFSLGLFTSVNFPAAQPSNSQNGRTLSVTISGNNVDFSAPVQVTIQGISGISLVTETINFTDYGTLDFVNMYISINYINVVVKPINSTKPAVNVVVKEKYPITHSESSGLVPVIRYSYQIGHGYQLQNDGYSTVRDNANLFSAKDIGNYLLINSPASVAGFYKIDGISTDRKALSIVSTPSGFPIPLAGFNNGVYQILDTTEYRSGLQNGFFTLEAKELPSQGYFLSQGFYELQYSTYIRVKMDPLKEHVFFGSDFEGHHQLNAIMDQIKIYSVMLTDTRIGETIPANQHSVTKDFNSLKALKADSDTLVLMSFDAFPFVNSAKYYISPPADKHHFQSAVVVNENFGKSLVLLDKPLVVENDGILDTRKEGTIEFWTNPIYDTGNDPNTRFYFDAYGAIIEKTVSVDDVSVKLSSPAGKILRVTLNGGDPNIDYFVGGKIETDTQRGRQEESVSIGTGIVLSEKPILQVITVKIVGDFTGTDYFADGSVGTDKKTIYLGKPLPASNLPLVVTYQPAENNNDTINTQVVRLNRKLPYQNASVTVTYLPKGLQGDRMAIFKDEFGYINFVITASGIDYVVRGPTRWAKNTWHRVKASYKLNGNKNMDEVRLFLDGYEYTNVLFGSGLVFSPTPVVMGSSMVGDGYVLTSNIKFKDPINELFIGSQYTQESPVFSLLDNFRISNISRQIYAPYGEPLDVNYSSNIDMVFPVTQDLYTTYLLDFDSLVSLNTDFATIKNRETGSFDFSVNIFDSFGIVSSSDKVQEALEALIKVLKPANSKVFIEYTR